MTKTIRVLTLIMACYVGVAPGASQGNGALQEKLMSITHLKLSENGRKGPDDVRKVAGRADELSARAPVGSAPPAAQSIFPSHEDGQSEDTRLSNESANNASSPVRPVRKVSTRSTDENTQAKAVARRQARIEYNRDAQHVIGLAQVSFLSSVGESARSADVDGTKFPISSSEEKGKELLQLKPKDAESWNTIADVQLTPDGKWLVYRLLPVNMSGNAEAFVVLRSTSHDAERRYPVGPMYASEEDALRISPSGSWIAFKSARIPASDNPPQSSRQPEGVSIVGVSSGYKRDFSNVHQYAFGGNDRQEWVALLRHRSTGDVKGQIARPPNASSEPSARIACKRFTKFFGCPRTQASPGAAELVLLNLGDAKTESLASVHQFAFDTTGMRLAWAGKAGLQVRELSSGQTRLLDASEGSIYERMAWSPSSRGLAVLRAHGADVKRSLLVFRHIGTDRELKNEFTPGEWEGFSEGYEMSPDAVVGHVLNSIVIRSREPLIWREDEGGIFFGIRRILPRKPPMRHHQDDLVVWHWIDANLPTARERLPAKAEQPNYLSFVSLKDGRFIQLADETVSEIQPHRRGQFVLGFDHMSYRRPPKTNTYVDCYLIDIYSGTRTLLLKKLQLTYLQTAGPSPMLSPDGKHLLYMDIEQNGAYFAVNTATLQRRNLTKGTPTKFFDARNLTPEGTEIRLRGSRASFIQGWERSGAYVFVSDHYDIWALPIGGGRAINITGDGRHEEIVYTAELSEQDPPFLDVDASYRLMSLDAPMPIRAIDLKSMRTGLGQITPRATQARVLRWQDADVSCQKSAQSATYICSRQTAINFPDLYRFDEQWRPMLRLTDANPQQRKFFWSSGARLVTFTTSTSEKLNEVLHLPAGYQPGRSYPTIVTVYQHQGFLLHHYKMPSSNIARWTQHGYAVLEASNRPRLREAGAAAVEGVLAGIDAAVATGVVDPNRLGLTGHSYGGYLTNFLITRTKRFRAAVSTSGFTDLFGACLGDAYSPPTFCEMSQPYLGGPWWEHWDAYVDNSPVFRVRDVQTPLLLVHGDHDTIVPFFQAVEMFNTLWRLGDKPAVLLQYKNQGHAVFAHEDAQMRILEFFGHFLQDAPAPSWWTSGTNTY